MSHLCRYGISWCGARVRLHGAVGCKECAGIISGAGLTEKMEKERGMKIQISRREGGRERERKREGVLTRRDVLSFQWDDSVAGDLGPHSGILIHIPRLYTCNRWRWHTRFNRSGDWGGRRKTSRVSTVVVGRFVGRRVWVLVDGGVCLHGAGAERLHKVTLGIRQRAGLWH